MNKKIKDRDIGGKPIGEKGSKKVKGKRHLKR